jgi:hypothetical protein
LIHGPVLSTVTRHAVAWLAGRSGYAATLVEVRVRALEPVRLTGVALTRPGGTRLQAAEVDLEWARWGEWGWSPSTWIRRAEVRGLSGQVAPALAAPPAADRGAPAPVVPSVWPRMVEVIDGSLSFAGYGCSVDLSGFDLRLEEGDTGSLRVREARARAGSLEKNLRDLSAVTAWRQGVAYFADLTLGENVVIDALSLALAGPAGLTLEARVGGGYLYADLGGGGPSVKAAVNALNLSLSGVAEFAGVAGDMAGTVDLAKLTFNGDPADPLAGQMSVRIEAKDFAWRKNAVEELAAGLSIAGRRIRLSECRLRQKANDVKLRGTVTLPTAPADWRLAPFEFGVEADVGDLRALAGLFGPPWNELSGGLRVAGQGSGLASDGQGWLKIRGWDLRARGLPAGSLQADLKLEGRDLKLTGLDAQSGPDFARGGGQLVLGDTLSYQGRLELRLREVSRYLEPLGRFAPDWARQGGVLLFWDGDGSATAHSGVATLELVRFAGDLNPVPVNGKLSASYSPGNVYVSRFLLDRGPLSLSSTIYFGGQGLAVQDLQMFSGRSRLLRGEVFLPLSLESVLAGRPWEQTLLKDGEVYAFLRTDHLDLESLVELFGQETTLRGRADLSLDARGPWENARIDGTLSLSRLRAAFPSLRIPDAQASLKVQVKDRRASLEGRLQPDGAEAVEMQADLPLLGATAEGGWTLVDYDAPWTASLDLPPVSLASFAPVLAGAVFDRGTVSGRVRLAGTPSAPRAEGALEWKNGRIALPAPWQPVEDITAKLGFHPERAVFEETRGRMGRGTFGLAGQIGLADWRDPRWELQLRGADLAFYADANLRLLGTPDLEARGTKNAGEIKGTLGFDGSAVLRGLAVTARGPATEPAPARSAPPPAPRPGAAWTCDLRMPSSAPIPVGPDGRDGLLAPDLYLQGTVGAPLLLGTVRARDLQLRWPSGTRLTADGRIHFTRDKPWLPVLDLTAAGKASVYDIQAAFRGALDERKLILSSIPPLAAGQIILLLNTGLSPAPLAPPVGSSSAGALTAEPSWLELGSIRGLLGWPTGGGRGGATAPGAEEAAGYEWNWR